MIRRAHASEANRLSDIAYYSKAYWGYSDEFMEACRGELRITSKYLKNNTTFVLAARQRATGFYVLERISDRHVELGHFFLSPEEIGQGRGRQLFSHACEQARLTGFRILVIASDPHAEGFYRAVGAHRVGSIPSQSISGRTLPLLEFDLAATPDSRGR
jgi:GNAT superfamily N-acetyltransferase